MLKPSRGVWIALLVYVAILGAVAVARWKMWTYGGDTGTFTQVVLDACCGFRDGPENGTHFRFHWSPILAALTPLLLVARSGLTLQLAQIVLVGATAPLLYLLIRPYSGERVATWCAVLALIYPPLTAVAFADFHENAFAPPVSVALLLAADRGAWWAFAAVACCAVLIREDASLVFVFIGAAIALAGVVPRRMRERLLILRRTAARGLIVGGCGLALAAAGSLAVYYGIVIPRVGPWPPSHFYSYSFGNGPVALLRTLALQPWRVIAETATPGRATYLAEALLPLLFVPLRSWWSILALPGLGIIVLSSDASVWRMGMHYVTLWAPWLLVAAACALAAIAARSGERVAGRWFAGCVAACALVLIAFDPMHPVHYLRPAYSVAQAARALAFVPRDAIVFTHDEWYSHIAAGYPHATMFARNDLQYIVVAEDYPSKIFQERYRPQLAAIVRAQGLVVRARVGRVVVYGPRGAVPVR